MEFSDPREVLLSMNSMKFMLDLDTGQTMDPPARQRPEQEAMDVYPTQWQPYERPESLTCHSLLGIKVTAREWSAPAADLRTALASDRAVPITTMEYVEGEPATYFFTTRDGTSGILQLLGVVEEPKGIRLRYKTLIPITR